MKHYEYRDPNTTIAPGKLPLPKRIRKALMGLECAIASGDENEVEAAIGLVTQRFVELTALASAAHQRSVNLRRRMKAIRALLREE